VDDALGLLLLVAYIVGIVGLAAAITYAVIRIFPTERKPKDPEKTDSSSASTSTDGAGKLFRRSKRAAT
jgi:hypothetical protein